MIVEAELKDHFERFLRGWGPIQWRESVVDVPSVPESSIGGMFWALSNIEDDSLVMRRKLAYGGLDRLQVVKDFNVCWLAEEAEHARALAYMAVRRGWLEKPLNHGIAARDHRSAFGNLALFASRVSKWHLMAAYFVLGTIQEFVALSTYNALGQLAATDDAEGSILRAIAQQEGRHMRFYRSSGQTILKNNPSTRRSVEVLVNRFWRPPGVDLLGEDLWFQCFAPLMRGDDLLREIERVDQLVAAQFHIESDAGARWVIRARQRGLCYVEAGARSDTEASEATP